MASAQNQPSNKPCLIQSGDRSCTPPLPDHTTSQVPTTPKKLTQFFTKTNKPADEAMNRDSSPDTTSNYTADLSMEASAPPSPLLTEGASSPIPPVRTQPVPLKRRFAVRDAGDRQEMATSNRLSAIFHRLRTIAKGKGREQAEYPKNENKEDVSFSGPSDGYKARNPQDDVFDMDLDNNED